MIFHGTFFILLTILRKDITSLRTMGAIATFVKQSVSYEAHDTVAA